MGYYKISYSNGYCGCDDEEYVEMDSKEAAENQAVEGLNDYGESYSHCAEGCSFKDGWESDEAEADYFENLGWSVEEVTEEEFDENQ